VTEVAIISVAELPPRRRYDDRGEVELVAPVITEALSAVGLSRRDLGFVCSGSCDFLVGRPFSFVSAVDGLGPWPPMRESHVEMDGAWALYEAWVRLQHGDIDTALVYAFGKSSVGDLADVLVQQLDPYYTVPLGPDPISLAALQARALIDAGLTDEAALAATAARHRSVDPCAPYLVAPLRRHDCPPLSDGAAAIVLATGDRARALRDRPAWIRGIDHRIEPHSLGARDLTRSPSTALAAERAGVRDPQLAELHAPFTHQEIILRRALGLAAEVVTNAGGIANPMMVAGLSRIGAAARALMAGEVDRAVAHATSGPCLQHNLVAMLEAA